MELARAESRLRLEGASALANSPSTAPSGVAGKPSVLLVAPFYPPAFKGGVARLYDCLCSSITAFDVSVLADTIGATPEDVAAFDVQARESGYRIRRTRELVLHFEEGAPWQKLLRMRAYLRIAKRDFEIAVSEINPDVIICGNSYPCGWLFLKLPRGRRWVNYVLGEEMTMNLEYGPIARWFKRTQLEALRRSWLNIAISRFSADKVAEAAGAPREHTVFLPCPVDTRRFRPPVDREADRRQFGWTGKTVLLTVARLVDRKGIDNVLRALHAARSLPEDFRYVIAGTGPQEKSLRAMCAEFGIEDCVEFMGFVADDLLPNVYGAADLFIQANRAVDGDTEGFGIVYLEANACGLPVIGGTAGGTADAIEEGVSGLRVDGDSVDAIREAIEKLLLDPVARAEMAATAQKRALQDFSLDAIAARLECTLTKVLGMPTPC